MRSVTDELTVDRDDGGDVVRIEGRVEWRVVPAEGGRCVGVCDSLNLTLEAGTWPEMVTEVADATKWLLADLCADGDLDRFLADRGWAVHGRPHPGATFDIPIYVLPAGADSHDPAVAAG